MTLCLNIAFNEYHNYFLGKYDYLCYVLNVEWVQVTRTYEEVVLMRMMRILEDVNFFLVLS